MKKWNYAYIINAILLLALLVLNGMTYGQNKKPVYANYQISSVGLLASITNAGNAIDGNPKNSANIKVLALGKATQFLGFSTDGTFAKLKKIPIGTEITIKYSMPKEVLGVASGLTIGTFNNLSLGFLGAYGTSVQEEFLNSASLLGLLKGYGVFEYKITTTKECQGVYIAGASILSINFTVDVFHAYIMENAVLNSCVEQNMPMDVLYGARSNGLITDLVSVADPYNVLNDNPLEFASINTAAGILTTSFIQTIFPTPSTKTQLVRVVLERPNALLDLALLSTFSIQTYLGQVPVGLPIKASNFLALRLLPGTQKFEVLLKVTGAFDRVEIALDNTVTVLTKIHVYEIRRFPYMELLPEPQLAANLAACEELDLKAAIANISPSEYNYYFYQQELGGSRVNAIIRSSGVYYIEVEDKLTGCRSPRQKVQAYVFPLPGKPHLTIMNVIN